MSSTETPQIKNPAPEPKPADPVKAPEPKPPTLEYAKLAGERFRLVEKPRFKSEIAKAKQPEPGSLFHWALQKQAPVWLAYAMAAGQPVNRLWGEEEFDAHAAKIAGLVLGRKGA